MSGNHESKKKYILTVRIFSYAWAHKSVMVGVNCRKWYLSVARYLNLYGKLFSPSSLIYPYTYIIADRKA